MNLFAAKPNIAASLRLLPLEDYVTFHGDFEARTELKREVGEKGTFGNGFGVDGGEEGVEEGDAVAGGGGFGHASDRGRSFGVGWRSIVNDVLRLLAEEE